MLKGNITGETMAKNRNQHSADIKRLLKKKLKVNKQKNERAKQQ